MRCMALADGLASAGWSCIFASRKEHLSYSESIINGRYDIISLDVEIKDEPACIHNQIGDVEFLVVDHYERGIEFEIQCKSFANAIIVIDDAPDRDHNCDILIDQTYRRNETDYQSRVRKDCFLLTGTDYALLRPEFRKARILSSRGPKTSTKLELLLISCGFTDPDNLTGTALDILFSTDLEFKIDVVLGAGAPHLENVREKCLLMGEKVKLHISPPNMAELMIKADLAISTAGSSSWERCCIGLPALMMIAADNQRNIASELSRIGAASLIDLDDAEFFATQLKAFVEDPVALQEMSEKSKALCDGLGVARVVVELSPPCSKSGEPIRLRRAIKSDGDQMLLWQQSPDVRKYFHNPRVPNREQHFKWLQEVLDDPTRSVLIIHSGNKQVGVLRLDDVYDLKLKKHVSMVSIIVSSEYNNHGIGAAVLRCLRATFPDVILCAEVREGNVASYSLFRSAGYRYDDISKYYMNEDVKLWA